MLDTFDMFAHADESVEPYIPTAQDLAEMHADYEEMKSLDGHCCECGAELIAGDDEVVCPECDDWEDDDDEPSDDFPMYLEYDGPFGLRGYDSFYDSCGEY